MADLIIYSDVGSFVGMLIVVKWKGEKSWRVFDGSISSTGFVWYIINGAVFLINGHDYCCIHVIKA